MEKLLQDVRYGLRMLLKRPAFTLMTLAALALGVGANTAIFSVVNAVVLRPLPFPQPERLVMIWGTFKSAGVEHNVVSYPNFADVRAQSQSFDALAAYTQTSATLARDGGEPERLEGALASADIFAALGTNAARGRVFTREEDRAEAQPVVVLSDNAWRSRFNTDPNIVGKVLTLNSRAVTVVGVMPAGFKFPVQPVRVDYWMPLANDPTVVSRSQRRGIQFLNLVARLKSNVTHAQAQAELSTIGARLAAADAEHDAGLDFQITGLHEEIVGDIRPALLVLLGAVGFVLLIACANVANLLLARATSRQKEIAIRTAMGAGRWRIVRQLLTESLLLSLVGGGIGLFVATWGVQLLLALVPADIPRAREIGLDARVLLFTLGVSLVAGLLFGLAPALQASRPDLNESLKEGARGSTGGAKGNRVRSLLVVSEVALSLVLLAGAGLLVKSFVRLRHVSPGFEAERVLVAQIILPRAKYAEPAQQAAFFRDVIERAKTVPGVESVGATNLLPLSGDNRTATFTIAGEPTPPDNYPEADARSISADYFRAMGVPLLRGRVFTDHDAADQPRVMIVNNTFVRRFFASDDPLTKRIELNNETWQIVGVVGDVRHAGLDAPPAPEFYVPYAQSPERWMTLVARTNAAASSSVAAGLRDAVRSVDRDVFFPDTHSMTQLLADSLARRRFNMLLIAIFACVALLLAAVGIYGVISYTVTQRTHEIGIRVALGAQPRDVLRLVVGQGMTLAAAGLAIGLVAALAIGRAMTGLLFEVGAGDPTVLAAVALLLAAVALVACLVPARRASKVDPMVALRYE